MKRLAILGVALLLATPGVSSAQFRTIIPVGGFGYGWPYGYGGWPGYGYGGYPYTFGGMSPYSYSYPYSGMGYGFPSTTYSTGTTYYSIPNAGMPWTSLGGLPTRWNGVDLTGAGNLATYQPNYNVPDRVVTPRSGTLPAANVARDRAAAMGDLRAHVRVRVPAADANVTIQGQSMQLTNGSGRYVSPELEPGERYVYEVRARWTDPAGRRHNEGRSVGVRAGEQVDVSFVPPRR